ncbi:DGA1 [Candida theae]|uniref:diacylglycerol O-acyltransferase n=1 Tax=Candida theae TaxID=1198502 RepID=A0AAD5G0D8_9ASCO|nr:DGA1 [Candida theae]KAI5965446.1 DGA1 [Candida theae]
MTTTAGKDLQDAHGDHVDASFKSDDAINTDAGTTTGSTVFEIPNDSDIKSRQQKKRSPTQDSATSIGTTSSTTSRGSVSSVASAVSSSSSTSASGGGGGGSRKRKNKKAPYLHIAPLSTPLKHRLETLAIVWLCVSLPAFITLFFICISLGWVVWLTVILPYFIWWYGFDLHTPTNGKVSYRVRNSMKNFIIWEWFVNYFPIRAHKTIELEPTFTKVLVKQTGSNSQGSEGDEQEDGDDDELDLVSEDATTVLDNIFKFIGLKKRLNRSDDNISVKSSDSSSSCRSSSPPAAVYKRVSTGPRYIFGYHPHGVISMGAIGLFGTNALRNEPYEPVLKWLKPFFHDPSKFETLFPGLGQIFALTLTTQFTVPFYRDYLMSMGLSSASAKNIKSLINNGDNSVCLVIGGAKESLLNTTVSKNARVGYGYKGSSPREEEENEGSVSAEHTEDVTDEKDSINEAAPNGGSNGRAPSTHDEQIPLETTPPKKQIKLVLANRKGFVKLAIELGNINLVPTFAFGEADVYDISIPKPGSIGYKFQQWMKRTFAFTIPFFSARGVFIYDFGLLPYRNPIDIVIGRPIHIPAGVLQEYRAQHPEEFEDEVKEPKEQKENVNDKKDKSDAQSVESASGMSRSSSFTDFLKLTTTKRGSSVKAKIPQKLLDKYHKLYVDELRRVYEDNKGRFGYGDVELNIID